MCSSIKVMLLGSHHVHNDCIFVNLRVLCHHGLAAQEICKINLLCSKTYHLQIDCGFFICCLQTRRFMLEHSPEIQSCLKTENDRVGTCGSGVVVHGICSCTFIVEMATEQLQKTYSHSSGGPSVQKVR